MVGLYGIVSKVVLGISICDVNYRGNEVEGVYGMNSDSFEYEQGKRKLFLECDVRI